MNEQHVCMESQELPVLREKKRPASHSQDSAAALPFVICRHLNAQPFQSSNSNFKRVNFCRSGERAEVVTARRRTTSRIGRIQRGWVLPKFPAAGDEARRGKARADVWRGRGNLVIYPNKYKYNTGARDYLVFLPSLLSSHQRRESKP